MCQRLQKGSFIFGRQQLAVIFRLLLPQISVILFQFQGLQTKLVIPACLNPSASRNGKSACCEVALCTGIDSHIVFGDHLFVLGSSPVFLGFWGEKTVPHTFLVIQVIIESTDTIQLQYERKNTHHLLCYAKETVYKCIWFDLNVPAHIRFIFINYFLHLTCNCVSSDLPEQEKQPFLRRSYQFAATDRQMQ